FLPEAMRFVNDGSGFFVGEVDLAVENTIGFEVISAIGVILYPVRAVHDLFAHGFANAFNPIRILHAGRYLQLPGIVEQGIHARRGHGAGRDLHARAGHFAASDGLFYVDVGVHGAFGFQVANCRDAVFEGDPRVAGSENGAIRNGLLEELLVVVGCCDIAVEEDVRVRVNEARKNCGFRKVYHFGALRRRAPWSDGNDGVTLNYYGDVVQNPVVPNVNKMTGANRNGFFGGGFGLFLAPTHDGKCKNTGNYQGRNVRDSEWHVGLRAGAVRGVLAALAALAAGERVPVFRSSGGKFGTSPSGSGILATLSPRSPVTGRNWPI